MISYGWLSSNRLFVLACPKQTGRQASRQGRKDTNKQADKQGDREAHKHTHITTITTITHKKIHTAPLTPLHQHHHHHQHHYHKWDAHLKVTCVYLNLISRPEWVQHAWGDMFHANAACAHYSRFRHTHTHQKKKKKKWRKKNLSPFIYTLGQLGETEPTNPIKCNVFYVNAIPYLGKLIFLAMISYNIASPIRAEQSRAVSLSSLSFLPTTPSSSSSYSFLSSSS